MHQAIALSLLLAVAVLLLPSERAAAEAPVALHAAWPEPGELRDLEGEAVTFASLDPFAFTDVADAASITAQAQLFLPEAASAQTPVPAVVLMHGAGGVRWARELTYARQLAGLGLAALVIDSFAPRRDGAGGFVNRLLQVTESMLLADAFSGLRYLDERPEVDGGRIALIGFSYGAMVSVFAAFEQVAEAFAPEGLRFAAHAAYYGPCIARFEDRRATGAPVLMQLGGRDAITDPARCREVLDDLQAGGAETELIVYDEAYHQWDGSFAGPREVGRDLSPCRFVVRPDGVVREHYTWIPMSSFNLRRLALGLCARQEGYLMGRDDEVRRASNAALGRFLSAHLF